MKKNKVMAIVAAAGKGTRLCSDEPKQFIKIGEEPMICKSVRPFLENEVVDALYVVVPKGYEEYSRTCFEKHINAKERKKLVEILSGGKERQDSIYNALRYIDNMEKDNWIVLIHDGARPFVSSDLINRVVDDTYEAGAVIPTLPITDTVRIRRDDILEVIDRNMLSITQTPQAFRRDIIMDAYRKAIEKSYYGTDDAQLVQWAGYRVSTVTGDVRNKKITVKEDLDQILNKKNDMISIPRIGMGYDVHRLVEGRKLILGGVEIPFKKGLDGHSDADVLVHAIMDSLLGAAGEGDIGIHFPPEDIRYKGVSSIVLLKKVKEILNEKLYVIGNIDATLICEKPKIKEYAMEMKKNICQALSVNECRVNIKATTTEKLGFEGRGEGIAAEAISLINKI